MLSGISLRKNRRASSRNAISSAVKLRSICSSSGHLAWLRCRQSCFGRETASIAIFRPARTRMVTAPPRPLDGILVLDFTTLLPGPMAGLILAEAGAEVIKIEGAGHGA